MPIRRLLPADAAAYRALMLQAYEQHPDAFTSSAAERSRLPLGWWEARLSEEADARELVFGAFDDMDQASLVGVAGLQFDAREKARHKANLFGMYVQPSARNSGAGRQLVQAVLAQARQRPGTRTVTLTVTDGNDAARRLYEGCGFVQFGLEPLAVKLGDAFHAKVHMWCDLDA